MTSTLPEASPRGHMRITASVPVTHDVSPAQIATYLLAKGWIHKPVNLAWCGNVERYLPPPGTYTDARDREGAVVVREAVIVPHLADWYDRTYDILRSCAAVEKRPTGDVLRDIAQTIPVEAEVDRWKHFDVPGCDA